MNLIINLISETHNHVRKENIYIYERLLNNYPQKVRETSRFHLKVTCMRLTSFQSK